MELDLLRYSMLRWHSYLIIIKRYLMELDLLRLSNLTINFLILSQNRDTYIQVNHLHLSWQFLEISQDNILKICHLSCEEIYVQHNHMTHASYTKKQHQSILDKVYHQTTHPICKEESYVPYCKTQQIRGQSYQHLHKKIKYYIFNL